MIVIFSFATMKTEAGSQRILPMGPPCGQKEVITKLLDLYPASAVLTNHLGLGSPVDSSHALFGPLKSFL
jgi:hypothetical protein